MKKLIALILAVIIIFGAVLGVTKRSSKVENGYDQAQSQPLEATQPEETETTSGYDFDKVYNKYNPDEVVMNISGRDITWDMFYSFLYSYVGGYQAQGYFSDVNEELSDGSTVGDIMKEITEQSCAQQVVIEALGAANGISVSEDEINERIDSVKTMYIGENATDEQFKELLDSSYMTVSGYKYAVVQSVITEKLAQELYGESAEKVSDEDAVEYLNSNDYITAAHILILTKDMNNGSDLSDEAKAAAKTKIEEIHAELKAIEDKEALLARFNELKAEHCEDSGKVSYPEGYVFTYNQMVKEFETAAFALKEYELSEIVESTYGYHIILRLPQNPDVVMTGSQASARITVASEKFDNLIVSEIEKAEIEYTDKFKNLTISDILT